MRKKASVAIFIIAALLITMTVLPYSTSADGFTDVALGKETGGWHDGMAAYNFTSTPPFPTSNMVDGDETTGAGFYYNKTSPCKGYMFIDLGQEYKIDHIDIVSYDNLRPRNANGFDVIVSNVMPDQNPYDPTNHDDELLVGTLPVSDDQTTADNGRNTLYMPQDIESYRYVSFEQFSQTINGYGLMIQDVKVYVRDEDLPEEPAYIEIAKDKPVSGNASNNAGLLGEGGRIVDGNDTTYAGFYGNRGTTGNMIIDLGVPFKIHHIEVLGYTDNANYQGRAGNCDIVLSNTAVPGEASDDPDKTVIRFPANPSAYQTLYVPKESLDKAYRYLSFEKFQNDGFGLLIAEVKVYIDEENLPFYISNIEFSVSGDTLTVSSYLTNGEAGEVSYIFASHDENGALAGIIAGKKEIPEKVFSEPFEVKADISSISQQCGTDFYIVDSLKNLNILLAAEDVLSGAGEIKELSPLPLSELQFEAKQKGRNAEISGSAPGNLAILEVLKPGADMGSITADNINDNIVYFGSVTPDAGEGEFSEEIPMPAKAENGEYTAVLGLVSEAFSLSDRTKTFEFLSMTEAFKNVTSENFLETAEKYKESYEELFSVLEEQSETIGESFMLAKAVFESGEVNGEVKNLDTSDNIITVIRAAVLIDKTRNSDAFSDEAKLYGDTMPLVFDKKYTNVKNFEKLLGKMKEGGEKLDSVGGIVKAYKRCSALSAVLKGTRDDIVWAMKNYADALDVDTKRIEKSGVSYNDIAKRISNTESDVYKYLKNGMGEAVSNAISKIEDDNKSSSGSTSNKSSGGGGGGGGTSYGYTPPANTNNTSENNGEQKTYPADNNSTDTNPAGTASEYSSVYTDLAGYEWAVDAINSLTEKEIVNGVGDGKYDPARYITREEAAKLIVLVFKVESILKRNIFEDCDIDLWYYPYVTAASANGIVKGYDRTHFGIGDGITRQDMAVMLERALAQKGVSFGINLNNFSDIDLADEYALSAINNLASVNIIAGMKDGTFAPKEYVTRAQAAVMLNRVWSLLGERR